MEDRVWLGVLQGFFLVVIEVALELVELLVINESHSTTDYGFE